MLPLPRPIKIVFFGTSDFAVPILERLKNDADFEILEVVTQPDKPVGRKRLLTAPPVKRAAQTFGLAVFQPETVRGEEALAHFAALGADLFVVVAYGKILPRALLELPKHGAVNVHGSILPKYRGAAPVAAAIAAGEKKTGVTVMVMDEKMDEGPILAVSETEIADDDTAGTLTARLAKSGADLLAPTLKLYVAGQAKPVPQDHAAATYTKKLGREDGRIDWTRSAVEIERLIRAMSPWPEAHFYWKRDAASEPIKITVKKAAFLHRDRPCDNVGAPKTACRLNDGRLGVNCGAGSLELQRLQMEGKAETDGKSFLNGYPDFSGARLS